MSTVHSIIGTLEQENGRQFIRTHKLDEGCVLYGPYQHLGKGRYSVKFDIRPDEDADPGVVCCKIDVVSNLGRAKLLERMLSVRELRDTDSEIEVEFKVLDTGPFEYRVFATGTAGLRVACDLRANVILDSTSDLSFLALADNASENQVFRDNYVAISRFCSKDIRFKTVEIRDLPRQCFSSEVAANISGIITYPKEEESKLKNIRLNYHGAKKPESLSGVEINLSSIPASLWVSIGNSQQQVRFGQGCLGNWVFRLWGPCSAIIGDDVTSGGVECFLNDGGSLLIGDDCMFAAGISFHVGDNHATFDIATGKVLNYSEQPSIELEPHVWVATRAIVLADTMIGRGSIIGAGSVAKGVFAPCSIIAGSPARIVKEGVSWTRSYFGNGKNDIAEKLGIKSFPQSAC